jgi:hypothetical protein
MSLTGRPIITGPERQECPCGCQQFGVVRTRMMGDGLYHVKLCPCRRCQGARHKPRSRAREHKVAKAVGGTRNIGSGAFGGTDVKGGVLEIEETSNVGLVAGLKRWWLSKQIQDKTEVLMAQKLRPRAFVASWNGKPQLAVLTFDDLRWLCEMRGDGSELKAHTQRIRAELAVLESKL